MSRRVVRDVTRRPDGSWANTVRGADRASSVSPTQREATDKAVGMAKSDPLSQVVIHRPDGRIREERTYGRDPYPPKG
jgi:hypothetical protein